MAFDSTLRIWDAVGWILTLTGVSLALVQLRWEYRWRRRQYAVDMGSAWNEHTAAHREAIEQAFPGLLDVESKRADVAVSRERAEELYFASSANRADSDLNRHIIELLNYCEYVAISYANDVSDRTVIEGSFKEALLQWHRGLRHYITVTTKIRAYNPWLPFCEVVSQWDPKEKNHGHAGF